MLVGFAPRGEIGDIAHGINVFSVPMVLLPQKIKVWHFCEKVSMPGHDCEIALL